MLSNIISTFNHFSTFSVKHENEEKTNQAKIFTKDEGCGGGEEKTEVHATITYNGQVKKCEVYIEDTQLFFKDSDNNGKLYKAVSERELAAQGEAAGWVIRAKPAQAEQIRKVLTTQGILQIKSIGWLKKAVSESFPYRCELNDDTIECKTSGKFGTKMNIKLTRNSGLSSQQGDGATNFLITNIEIKNKKRTELHLSADTNAAMKMWVDALQSKIKSMTVN
jgi:hypothetical protein